MTAPFVFLALLAVWLQDFRSPFYLATRTGKHGKPFKMVKIRSMRVDADKAQVWATKTDDPRITLVGAIIRKCKLDEIPQLWNVLVGQMSLVGPRPLALSETAVYTEEERQILEIVPGVTDIASLVLINEEELLAGSDDPTTAYDRLIRPWKSRYALAYLTHRSFWLDCTLVILTALAIVNRSASRRLLARTLTKLALDESLVEIAAGTRPIMPIAPPGTTVVG